MIIFDVIVIAIAVYSRMQYNTYVSITYIWFLCVVQQVRETHTCPNKELRVLLQQRIKIDQAEGNLILSSLLEQCYVYNT